MKTVREEKIGKGAQAATLRVVAVGTGLKGVVLQGKQIVAQVEGDDADAVMRQLRLLRGRTHPDYFGFDGAVRRFLEHFPDGFRGADFHDKERSFKDPASKKLREAAPVEAAASDTGFARAALSAMQGTTLIHPIEKSRMTAMLKGSDADRFVQGAARFALDDRETGLAMMREAALRHDAAKWTILTYLPFLWRPDRHMYLKPEVTRDFANRVGHDFAEAYSPAHDLAIYDSLLDLVDCTREGIADLEPADNIDIQSFVWVVGYYGKSAAEPAGDG